jgi:outer membrane protein OmpA-like peptidoglycan-associated protein/tetratricopeptide (TPR) repeat protein
MKRTTLFLIIFLCAISLQSFSAGTIRKAKREIRVYDYSSAITLLKKIVDQNNPKTIRQATLLLAECYRKKNNFAESRTWYGKVLEQEHPDPLSYLYFAMSLQSTGEYNKAKTYFLKFDSLVPKDPRGKIYASYCDSIKIWEKKGPFYDVTNVPGINGPTSDFGPSFYGNKLCFTSDRFLNNKQRPIYGWTGNNYLKIFFADFKEPTNLFQGFGEPVSTGGKLKTKFHNGPATFDSSNLFSYFNRTYKGEGERDLSNIKEDLLKIYYSQNKKNGWSKPHPFVFNSKDYSVGHPALTKDSKSIYFVSNMPGGFGGTDIYVSTMDDGKWTKPINLGPKINTFGNEMFPYIAGNGNLYFASDGLPGYGSLDIFMSKKINGEWTYPMNMGKSINSSYDDFALAEYKSTNTGLFCSNRPGSLGEDDLYFYKEKPPQVVPVNYYVKGCVKDKTTNQPVPGATVFLQNMAKGKVLVLKADNSGCFRTQIDLGTSYLAKAMKEGYTEDCEQFIFDVTESKTDLSVPRDLLLDKVVTPVFKLDNVYYDFDKWNIRPDAEVTLNTLVKTLKENNFSIELASHTDCRGTDAYNQKLSERRAESVRQYLISHGIDPSRITMKGYGESQPVNNCVDGVKCTEDQHQANRRTEFKIISSNVKAEDTFNPDNYKDGEMIDLQVLPSGFFKDCITKIASSK